MFGQDARLDSPQERYAKMTKGLHDFLLNQLGLVTFEWDPAKSVQL